MKKNLLCSQCKYATSCPYTGNLISSLSSGGIKIRYCEQFLTQDHEITNSFLPIEIIGKKFLVYVKKTLFPLKITEIKNLLT